MRILPNNLREKLQEPIGQLLTQKDFLVFAASEEKIVSVGDQVTYTLLIHNFHPIVCIVDYILQRKEYKEEMKNTIQRYGTKSIKVSNPAGCISDELWNAIQWAFNQIEKGPIRIDVEGEEDLAALAAIYLAPSDATVIYGMPNKGVVAVKANKEYKTIVKDILDKM